MIDREKVERGLECCIHLQDSQRDWWGDCERCPYNDNPSEGTCVSIHPLLKDARELIKEQAEEIASLNRALVAMNKLSEMQMETLEDICKSCQEFTRDDCKIWEEKQEG